MTIRTARTVAIGVLAVLTLLAVSTLVAPRLLGWTPYVVTSGSMAPTFSAGALVVSAPAAADDVSVGDVLTFRAEGGLTTHRLVERREITQDGVTVVEMTTKGDANEEADPTLLDARNLVGEARFAVPWVGYLVDFVKTPAGAGLAAALFLFVVMTDGAGRGRREDEAPGGVLTKQPATT